MHTIRVGAGRRRRWIVTAVAVVAVLAVAGVAWMNWHPAGDRLLLAPMIGPADAASAQAVLLLRRKGFSRAWPLAGGLDAWRALRGGPEALEMIQVKTLAV